ncbi:MAG: radical SAM protein, partial [Bacillota bacterium]|nr:radical SAM protein [Bacillota bacterium]
MGKLMIDGQGRVINYLRLSLTSECNLRCRYCLPEGRIAVGSGLTLADFAFIVEVAAGLGISRVRLTGGEPLLVQGLAEFVAEIRQYPGISDIALTTNAQGLANIASDIYRAGVSRANISLDSLQPERYAYLTRGGKLHVALQGVEAALDVGMFPVKINCVILGGINDDELEAFALWTRIMPISVRFIELMPFGEAANWPKGSFVSVRSMKER